MRLVTFTMTGQTLRPLAGLLLDNGVLDLDAAASQGREAGDFSSVLAVIQAGDAGLSALQRIAARASQLQALIVPLASVKLLAPIPRPQRNVFCVGRNYIDHVKESYVVQQVDVKLPSVPQFFTKATHTVIAHGDEVRLDDKVTSKLDYEVELAVIIGKGGRDIPREDALSHVFGFSIANDVTARDLQRRHDQWFKGKSLDTTLPLGPSIVTKDEVRDIGALELRMTINGEQRQAATASQMIFDIPTLIASLSAGMTLEAGDILITGTPSGVGFAMDPPHYLQPGDVMVASISGLGELTNRIVAANPT